MDIKIVNIAYDWIIEDLYTDNAKQRTFQMRGYIVEYYFNNYIKSTIDIATDKELTIDEIKEKIKEFYKEVK